MHEDFETKTTKFATIIRETGEVSAIANKSDSEPPFLDKLQEAVFEVMPVPVPVQVGMIYRDGAFFRREMDPRTGRHVETEVVRILPSKLAA